MFEEPLLDIVSALGVAAFGAFGIAFVGKPGAGFDAMLLCEANEAKEAGAGRLTVGAAFTCDGICGAGGPKPGGRTFTNVGFGKRGSPCGPPCN